MMMMMSTNTENKRERDKYKESSSLVICMAQLVHCLRCCCCYYSSVHTHTNSAWPLVSWPQMNDERISNEWLSVRCCCCWPCYRLCVCVSGNYHYSSTNREQSNGQSIASECLRAPTSCLVGAEMSIKWQVSQSVSEFACLLASLASAHKHTERALKRSMAAAAACFSHNTNTITS